MKIFITTCNTHLHLVPIFCHLFNKYWGAEQPVTLLGYNHPQSYKFFKLPENFSFEQLNGGDQGRVEDFSNHLQAYFSTVEDDYFIWGVEDTFLKSPVNFAVLNAFFKVCEDTNNTKIGRIDLTEGMSHRPTSLWKTVDGIDILVNPQDAEWRVTMQISIWNKEYLLSSLKPNRSPWDVEIFALQEALHDGWDILGTHREVNLAVTKNEGVTRHDIYKLNVHGMTPDTLQEIQEIINDKN